MKPEIVMENIKIHQQSVFLHSLTCANNSSHNDLVPYIENNQVVLKCTDCDYLQEYIPEVFYKESYANDIKKSEALLLSKGYILNIMKP